MSRPLLVGISGIAVATAGYLFGRSFVGKRPNFSDAHELNQLPTVAVYNKVAPIFDKSTNTDEFLMGIPILRMALLRNCEGDVLEVGAGTAKNLRYFPFRKLKSLTLVDNSSEMIKMTNTKIENAKFSWEYWLFPIQIESLEANSEKLPFPDNSFDTAVSTFTICSFDNPKLALSELKRVVKPNGKLLFLEHGMSCTDKPTTNSPGYATINDRLNKNAALHHYNWGCHWNRNIGDLVIDSFPSAADSFWRWHFGTTLYAKIINTGE